MRNELAALSSSVRGSPSLMLPILTSTGKTKGRSAKRDLQKTVQQNPRLQQSYSLIAEYNSFKVPGSW